MDSLNKYVYAVIILAGTCSLQAHAAASGWARLIKDLAFGQSIATDASGNTYCTGYYLQHISVGSVDFSSQGGADIFIAKLDPEGNPIWAKSAGGTGWDVPSRIACDSAGNSYLTGSFNGTATFGSFTVTSSGSTDGFLAKYDSKGDCQWVVKVGGRADDVIFDVTIDAKGFVYVTGQFGDAIIMGNGQLIVSTGGLDVFAAKFDASGKCLWVAQGGGQADDFVRGISVDATGNVYVTGKFSGSARFGTIGLSSSFTDMFLIKFDSTGSPLWARQSSGNAEGDGISTDIAGNSTIAGSMSSSTSFGNFQFFNPSATNAFVARYDTKGVCLWVSATSGTHYGVHSQDIKVDGQGNVVVFGDYTGTAVFGSKQLTSSSINNDLFVSRYDPKGNLLGVVSIGGPSIDYAGSVATDRNGRVLVTGTCAQSGTFGPNTVTGTGAFIAALTDNVLGVEDGNEHRMGTPLSFGLGQNYPNPFNPSTTFTYSIPVRTFVSLKIYDVMGREVASLCAEEMQPGRYSKQWNANGMPSGVYFYRLSAGAYTDTKRLLIIY